MAAAGRTWRPLLGNAALAGGGRKYKHEPESTVTGGARGSHADVGASEVAFGGKKVSCAA